MLQQTVRCRPGNQLLNLTSRDDHIAQSLTIEVTSHMNHHPVRQFDPQAVAAV